MGKVGRHICVRNANILARDRTFYGIPSLSYRGYQNPDTQKDTETDRHTDKNQLGLKMTYLHVSDIFKQNEQIKPPKTFCEKTDQVRKSSEI